MNKFIIIAVAILLLGAGGYFIFMGGNEKPSPQNQQPSVTESEIIIQNFAFGPETLTIQKGTTVVWVNNDSAPHSIKSDAFNSEIINKGGSFRFKFDNAGTYNYACGIHQSMRGEIIVQ